MADIGYAGDRIECGKKIIIICRFSEFSRGKIVDFFIEFFWSNMRGFSLLMRRLAREFSYKMS